MTKIGITIGDINGIGPEVILKVIANKDIEKEIDLVIYGPSSVLKKVHQELDLKNKLTLEIVEPVLKIKNISIDYGKPTKTSGEIAYKSTVQAIEDCKQGKIDAIVTAPISKKALHIAGYNYSGHTEILQKAFPNHYAQMLFDSKQVRLLVLTRHIPLIEVPKKLNFSLIYKNVLELNKNLCNDFGIDSPTFAICSLNPHAGESGTIGNEEENIIIPAINELRKTNINIEGPFSADSFWDKAPNYNCVIALYHDQGLIPLKLHYAEQLVNITSGLPITRTSPCHGTAFDIAGKGIANKNSLYYAIKSAKDIVKNRKNYIKK